MLVDLSLISTNCFHIELCSALCALNGKARF